MTEMLCDDCGRLALFEAPAIEDGLDDGTLACVVCGTAVVVLTDLALAA